MGASEEGFKWKRLAADAICAEGYMVTRYEHEGSAYFAAWHMPKTTLIASGWAESADEFKAACERHAQGREAA